MDRAISPSLADEGDSEIARAGNVKFASERRWQKTRYRVSSLIASLPRLVQSH